MLLPLVAHNLGVFSPRSHVQVCVDIKTFDIYTWSASSTSVLRRSKYGEVDQLSAFYLLTKNSDSCRSLSNAIILL